MSDDPRQEQKQKQKPVQVQVQEQEQEQEQEQAHAMCTSMSAVRLSNLQDRFVRPRVDGKVVLLIRSCLKIFHPCHLPSAICRKPVVRVL